MSIGRAWACTSSAATSARTFARGTAKRRGLLLWLKDDSLRDMFRHSPVSRAKYRGFLRNVAVAMGNARLEKFREPLAKLAASEDPLVAEHARWALGQLPA